MQMQDRTLRDFCAETASKSATPGGGSVAAAVGALGAALAQMVASLTVDKAGFEAVREEMRQVLEEGTRLRRRLLDHIDEDCAAYRGYMQALSLPKATEEEKAARRAALRAAAKTATDVPISIAEDALATMPLTQAVVLRGNRSAVTDGAMAALLARVAIRSAVLNARINLPALGDAALAAQYEAQCVRLEAEAEEQERAILAAAAG